LLSESDLDLLAGHARTRRYSTGNFLYTQGARDTQVFFILSGRFKVNAIGSRGNELLLGILEAGDLTGLVSLIDAGGRFCNAIALRSSEVIVIDRRHLLPMLEQNTEALLALLREINVQLRTAVDLSQVNGLLDSQGRLWSSLISLSKRYGRPIDRKGGLRIDHGLSQEDLAATIGMTRVVVNRALRSWRELGLVETGRGYVTILKPDRLEQLVLHAPKDT
jgi:CRP-like cAMP-binding protein